MGISPSGRPTDTIRPPFRRARSPATIALPFPVISTAASAPTPPVSRRTAWTTSFPALFTVTSAPMASASLSFSAKISQAMIRLAPWALQAPITISPMGPQPLTSTVFPRTSAFSTPWTPAPIASSMAPIS